MQPAKKSDVETNEDLAAEMKGWGRGSTIWS
jgi:hypothetical protein